MAAGRPRRSCWPRACSRPGSWREARAWGTPTARTDPGGGGAFRHAHAPQSTVLHHRCAAARHNPGVSPSATTVMWFRRDLRVDDHPALAAAAARGEVVALWVADPALLGAPHHRAPMRLRFLRACLEAVDAALADRGIGLVVRAGDPADVVPAVAREAGADVVMVTADVTPYSRRRDAAVADALGAGGIELEAVGGPWRVEPHDLAGSKGEGYLVFTPFWKAWDQVPVDARIPPPAALAGPALASEGLGMLPDGDPPLAAGPDAARARLEQFIRSGAVDRYGDARDMLADDGTSHLSADLRMGVISPSQVGRA
ncbi:MAG: hypothetical protein FJW78_03720, partial [Actinobacteria bacterium]|nr:hypothetical protein [Actinomycetota bacterium]